MEESEDPEKLLLPSEAAEILRVTTRTLRNWDKEDKLSVVLLPGRGRRYRLKDIRKISQRPLPNQ